MFKISSLLLLFLPLSFCAQFSELWHAEINGTGDFTDRFTCVCTDDAGNIYVGGSSVQPGQNADFLVARYSPSGNLDWMKTWNGSGSGPDEATDITFLNGKVYATGYLNAAVGGNDYFTIALSANGDSLWGQIYNDPVFNQYDEPNAIDVDASGNVAVCGSSDRDSTNLSNDDFLTVMYSSLGNLQWTARHNGTGNATDKALDLQFDPSGNVLVCGRTSNGFDDDYLTIKYSQSGTVTWTKIFDNGATDRAAGLGIDQSGNVYVTGRSNNGNDDDYRTIKYSSAGTELFNIVYDFVEDDRADFIDVESDGSFAIGGRSDASATALLNYNVAVVMYNANGAMQWTASYASAGINDDIIEGIDLNNGRVAITGFTGSTTIVNTPQSIFTALFNQSGSLAWANTIPAGGGLISSGNGVALNAEGRVSIAAQKDNSSNNRNALCVTYEVAGSAAFTNEWNGMGDNGDNIRDIVSASGDDLYICGYSVGLDTDRDMYIAHLDNAGNLTWSDRFSGTLFGSEEEANAIVLSSNGNPVISGYTKNSGSSSDITLRSYTSNGTLSWMNNFNGPANESDRSYDLLSMPGGNIYVTGKTDINNSPVISNDLSYTASHVPGSGAVSWTYQHNGGSGSERGRLLRTNAGLNRIYSIGRILSAGQYDLLLVCTNTSGTLLWETTFDANDGDEEVRDAVVDQFGNIIITGSADNAGSGDLDYFTCKFNDQGEYQWHQTYAGSSAGIDVAEGIVADNAGNIYVTGYSDSDAGSSILNSCVTIAYNADGNIIWQEELNADNQNDNAGDDIALLADGHVVVAAHENTGSNDDIDYDIVLTSYNSADGTIHAGTSFSISDSIDVANVIETYANNVIYLGGSTWSSDGQRNMLVVKYNLATEISEQSKLPLLTCYPNPAEETIQIYFDGSDYSPVEIVDATGRTIMKQGIYPGRSTVEIGDYSPGIYTIKISTPDTTLTKTFIKN